MRACRVGLLHICQYLLCIALQITNSHVYLSKCHSKRYDIHEKIPFSSGCIILKEYLSMEMQLYSLHVVPFIIIVYLAFLLFLRPPGEVILASLAGGLSMGR